MSIYNSHPGATQSRTTSTPTTTTTTKTATTPNKKPTYEELVAMNSHLKESFYTIMCLGFFYFLAFLIFACYFTNHGIREIQATLAAEMPPSRLVNETCQVLGSRAVDVSVPLRREVYDDGRVFDISHRIQPNMPSWGSRHGIGHVVSFSKTRKKGSLANNSEMKLATHTGTHVDAPGHVFDHYFDAGFDVDSLDLATLNGPALLVDVPRHTNITAKAMKSLHIPKGVKRVLFRTLNTARRLMWKKEFDTSYVGFMKDGAQWLVDNTDIKLVGVDYLSAAAYDDLIPSHHVFLEGREIILVEGLKLDNIEAGAYTVHCLPLRLVGADGSPARCILVK